MSFNVDDIMLQLFPDNGEEPAPKAKAKPAADENLWEDITADPEPGDSLTNAARSAARSAGDGRWAWGYLHRGRWYSYYDEKGKNLSKYVDYNEYYEKSKGKYNDNDNDYKSAEAEDIKNLYKRSWNLRNKVGQLEAENKELNMKVMLLEAKFEILRKIVR